MNEKDEATEKPNGSQFTHEKNHTDEAAANIKIADVQTTFADREKLIEALQKDASANQGLLGKVKIDMQYNMENGANIQKH